MKFAFILRQVHEFVAEKEKVLEGQKGKAFEHDDLCTIE